MPSHSASSDGVHLRLLWPQWQGAGTSSVRDLASEFPFDMARRGYAVGSAILEAIPPDERFQGISGRRPAVTHAGIGCDTGPKARLGSLGFEPPAQSGEPLREVSSFGSREGDHAGAVVSYRAGARHRAGRRRGLVCRARLCHPLVHQVTRPSRSPSLPAVATVVRRGSSPTHPPRRCRRPSPSPQCSSYGSRSNVSTWLGRTIEKWARSRVRIRRMWSRSATAMTLASAAPSGRLA